MSIIRNIHDKVFGILGRDCRGKPLKIGDPVEVVDDGTVRDECVGMRTTVAGAAPKSDDYPGEKRVRLANGFSGMARSLLKVDDENDEASWREVQRDTGWTPKTVRRDEEVPA